AAIPSLVHDVTLGPGSMKGPTLGRSEREASNYFILRPWPQSIMQRTSQPALAFFYLAARSTAFLTAAFCGEKPSQFRVPAKLAISCRIRVIGATLRLFPAANPVDTETTTPGMPCVAFIYIPYATLDAHLKLV